MALTEAEARDALERWVRTTGWRRRGLAARLEVVAFRDVGAFDVTLESLTEERTVSEASRPYRGESVDGASLGAPPDASEIRVAAPSDLTNGSHVGAIPHTEEVRTCARCEGRGETSCDQCAGTGRVRCTTCGGDGRVVRAKPATRYVDGRMKTRVEMGPEPCVSCGGDGLVRCVACGLDGIATCRECDGQKQVVSFQQLRVVWKCHVARRVLEQTALPDDLLRNASGELAYEETEPAIDVVHDGGGGPFRGARTRVNALVNDAINELLVSQQPPPGARLLKQRVIVRSVPVDEVTYRWAGATRAFWVYGTERWVHAPDFPVSIVRVGVVAIAGASSAAFFASKMLFD